jgi:arabinan endo-1,5-alpha-L-arabinosidase
LSDDDREADGRLRFRRLPTFVSSDLVNWTYAGDAMPQLPPQAAPTAGLWAPELAWVDGEYRLYYTITDVVDRLSPEPGCDADSAIGVARSPSPFGPWTVEPALVVQPRREGPGCKFHWTFDPDLLTTDDGRRLLYFGSYHGGLWVQPLDAAALQAQGAPRPIALSGRYEGAEVVRHAGAYWLFASSANCCNGALTGYQVFVGRAIDPLGPFVDRDGASFLDARIGGTPVLVQGANRWVGPGHNSVFTDDAGQWWTAYHAIDRNQATWTGSTLSRRPLLLDRLDWVGGWPQVAGGPSDTPRPAPVLATASRPTPTAHNATSKTSSARLADPERLRGTLLWRDDFKAPQLAPRWSWVRSPAAPVATGPNGLVMATEAGDLHLDTNNAPLLTAALPTSGDLWIETHLDIDLPPTGDLPKPVQAGLVLYDSDDRYLKLVHVALGATRQTEFALERPPGDADSPRYGNGVVGTPGAGTRLALLLRRQAGGAVAVTAFTQADTARWVQGATWLHNDLGPEPRIALVAMGGVGYRARFTGLQVHRALQR